MYEPQPNYTTQPHYAAPAHVVGDRRQADWRLIGAYIIAAFGVGAAVVCVYLLSSFKQVYASQMAKTNHALATAQAAQTKDAKAVSGLDERMTNVEATLVPLSAYTMICSTDLEGQNGPARFFFACSQQKPGS